MIKIIALLIFLVSIGSVMATSLTLSEDSSVFFSVNSTNFLYSNSEVCTAKNGVCSSGSGNPFDQSLNKTDNVTFNKIFINDYNQWYDTYFSADSYGADWDSYLILNSLGTNYGVSDETGLYNYFEMKREKTIFYSDSGNDVFFGINNTDPGYTLDVDGTIRASSLSGSGNAYACLDSNGKLYRSSSACN